MPPWLTACRNHCMLFICSTSEIELLHNVIIELGELRSHCYLSFCRAEIHSVLNGLVCWLFGGNNYRHARAKSPVEKQRHWTKARCADVCRKTRGTIGAGGTHWSYYPGLYSTDSDCGTRGSTVIQHGCTGYTTKSVQAVMRWFYCR